MATGSPSSNQRRIAVFSCRRAASIFEIVILLLVSGMSSGNGVVMSKSPSDKLEMLPDAWERFERAVDAVAKSGPQHKKREKAEASSRSSEEVVKDSGDSPKAGR
jgi:hypothetical protein